LSEPSDGRLGSCRTALSAVHGAGGSANGVADLISSSATELLDTLDGDDLEEVLAVAVELRDAAQAVIAGQD
jgi:hypothetical protein